MQHSRKDKKTLVSLHSFSIIAHMETLSLSIGDKVKLKARFEFEAIGFEGVIAYIGSIYITLTSGHSVWVGDIKEKI